MQTSWSPPCVCENVQVCIMKLCIFIRVIDSESSPSVVEVTYPGWIPIFHFVVSQHEISLSYPLIHISPWALLPTSLKQHWQVICKHRQKNDRYLCNINTDTNVSVYLVEKYIPVFVIRATSIAVVHLLFCGPKWVNKEGSDSHTICIHSINYYLQQVSSDPDDI